MGKAAGALMIVISGALAPEARVRTAFEKRAVTGGMTGFLGELEGVAPPRSLVLSFARPLG